MLQQDLKNSQNFIKDSYLVNRLLGLTTIRAGDLVLDIGAGEGILTKQLQAKGVHVLAYEKDKKLAESLRVQYYLDPLVKVEEQNFLTMPVPRERYKVFSNIPFNISSDIINKLLFSLNTAEEIYLIVQKEVAFRYLGVKEGKLLSLLIAPFFETRILYNFQKSDFVPSPTVNVVFISFFKKISPAIELEHTTLYRDFVSYIMFQQKETLWLRSNKLFTKEQFKRLANNFGFDLDIPARDVDFATWLKLFEYFVTGVDPYKKEVVKDAFRRYLYKKNIQPKVHRTKIAIVKPTPYYKHYK